jgi:MarR family transcriptional regulator, 2-MHQ and catechol-resistance regulon repressor
MPSEPTIRVPADFEPEFPGASRSAAEVAANLARTATAFVSAVERWPREAENLSASAFQTLAILEGADEPLAAHVIAERLLVRSASVTSLLDTLERRGLVERHPNPTDRRKILVYVTDEARRIVNEALPVQHAVITAAVGDVSNADREQLITTLATIWARLEIMAEQPLPVPKARRKRGAPIAPRPPRPTK